MKNRRMLGLANRSQWLNEGPLPAWRFCLYIHYSGSQQTIICGTNALRGEYKNVRFFLTLGTKRISCRRYFPQMERFQCFKRIVAYNLRIESEHEVASVGFNTCFTWRIFEILKLQTFFSLHTQSTMHKPSSNDNDKKRIPRCVSKKQVPFFFNECWNFWTQNQRSCGWRHRFICSTQLSIKLNRTVWHEHKILMHIQLPLNITS